MPLLTYIPRRPLADFVQLLWFYESGARAHSRERVLPTATMQMIVSLSDDPLKVFHTEHDAVATNYGSSVICGAHSQFSIIDTSQETSIGVHFRPGGAFPFLKGSAGELHNSHVSLADIFGSGATRLRERLLEAESPAAKFQTFESFLTLRLEKPGYMNRVLRFAVKELGRTENPMRVGDVVDRTGLTSRRFIELFTNEVGLTPKLYFRVQRFQGIILRLHQDLQIDWAQEAVSCGYYDQSHFNNDFRAFSGMTPTEYVERKGEYANHILIAD
jgi:AraC-like DNA-binding protein